VPALDRGLRLLACFGPAQPVWSAPELARKLELPRSTVFRMLTTLENSGYLQRSGTEYRLGLAVLRLGYDYLSTQPLAQLAEPVLQALCDELGMTSNLALRDGTSVVYVARVTPSGAFQGAVRVGSRLPAHATVLGRALLHDMDGAQLRSVFGGEELPQFSESTPRNVDELLRLLAEDRERGYAMGEGFYEPGVSSIAAPVRAADGRVVAGLAMAIPFTELGPEKPSSGCRRCSRRQRLCPLICASSTRTICADPDHAGPAHFSGG
jgi:DNA-binding IclR family transcriptional regulator